MKSYFDKAVNWIKSHKLVAVLILIILFLLNSRQTVNPLFMSKSLRSAGDMTMEYSAPSAGSAVDYPSSSRISGSNYYETAPRPDIADRKVITNSALSLQVNSVRDTMDKIKTKTRELGGYVVETNVETPEFGEDGSLVVRVPSDTLDETLAYFRGLAVKVVSENIAGTDITDQYVDIEERIYRLETSKAMVVEILTKAKTVEEILQVQSQIFNLQDQIDSYKGQLTYMEGASQTTMIRIYLSTDELGLPYAPAQAWRPQAVFKQATRSLVMDLIQIGNAAIWIVVYLPLLATAFLIFWLIKKVIQRKRPSSQ